MNYLEKFNTRRHNKNVYDTLFMDIQWTAVIISLNKQFSPPLFNPVSQCLALSNVFAYGFIHSNLHVLIQTLYFSCEWGRFKRLASLHLNLFYYIVMRCCISLTKHASLSPDLQSFFTFPYINFQGNHRNQMGYGGMGMDQLLNSNELSFGSLVFLTCFNLILDSPDSFRHQFFFLQNAIFNRPYWPCGIYHLTILQYRQDLKKNLSAVTEKKTR